VKRKRIPEGILDARTEMKEAAERRLPKTDFDFSRIAKSNEYWGTRSVIEWVFFDAGETLVSPRPSFGRAIEEICSNAGVVLETEDVDRVADECLKSFLDFLALVDEDRCFSLSPDKSRRFWTRYYSLFLEKAGAPRARLDELAHHIYDEFLKFERYAAFGDVLPTLERLSAAGLGIGVISNWEPWLEDLLDHLRLGEFISVKVISGREGIEKPNREMFERALERAGVHASRAVHVGDDPKADAEPAAELGIEPVIIDRRSRHPEVTWKRIESLKDLPRIIGV